MTDEGVLRVLQAIFTFKPAEPPAPSNGTKVDT